MEGMAHQDAALQQLMNLEPDRAKVTCCSQSYIEISHLERTWV